MSYKTKYSVRQIEKTQDIIQIMGMSRAFASESDTNEEVVDDCVIETCARIIADEIRGEMNIFIVHKADVAIGFLLATCYRQCYNTNRFAEQRLWYVKPEFRHTIAPVLLLRAFEAWAVERGAKLLFTGSTNHRYSETISSTVEKLGYERVGSTHLKKVS